jgi:UDP-N-acetylglucosamine 1-carboxyvinyltransferase
VISKDLRGGASLVVAALLSDKETIVENVLFIKRGYYNLVNKLRNVGANIEEI